MDLIQKVTKNTGVIAIPPRPGEYKLGGITAIIEEIRFADLDAQAYITNKERQFNSFGDTMACVSFSCSHDIEIHLNWLKANNRFTPIQLGWLKDNGYLNVDGKFDLSERFLAKVSGTTSQGNDLVSVWEASRKIGMVPASDWPYLETMSFQDFYAEVPQSLKDKAKKFLEIVQIQYEWVGYWQNAPVEKEVLKNAMKFSPVQITIPIPSHHATNLIKIDETIPYTIYDHYDPFIYTGDANYPINMAIRGMVTVKAPVAPRTLKYGMVGMDVNNLQSDLKKLKYLKIPLITLFFGSYTQNAVIYFQKDNGLLADGVVGPLTRAAIANAIAKKKSLVEQFKLQPKVARMASDLMDACIAVGINMRIISGLRTYAEQDALYAQGRTKPGPIVTNAKAGYSFHNHGLAFDIYIVSGGTYDAVGKLGKAIGLEWGGDFTNILDKPHFQLSNGHSIQEFVNKTVDFKEFA